MSPLGQFPNFLTDGSRIRRPPIGNTKNPTFRLASRTSKNFQYPASGRSPGSVFPALLSFIRDCAAFQPFTYHASVISVPIFIWSQVIITFSLSNIRFPGNRPLFFAVNFPCRFSKKLPVLFYVQHFSPLSVSLFSHLPPFPGSTIFSARRLCCLSPVITYFYSSTSPRSGLPSRFSPASDETAPSQPSFPSAFPQHLPTILKFCYLHTRHGKWFYPAWR